MKKIVAAVVAGAPPSGALASDQTPLYYFAALQGLTWVWPFILPALFLIGARPKLRLYLALLLVPLATLEIFDIPIMVSVHSVYGLFFGLLASKAGWFNPLQAPYFVLGAIVSGFSAIIVVSALLRRAYAWRDVLSDRIFKTFGVFLAFVVALYLYFLLLNEPGRAKMHRQCLLASLDVQIYNV